MVFQEWKIERKHIKYIIYIIVYTPILFVSLYNVLLFCIGFMSINRDNPYFFKEIYFEKNNIIETFFGHETHAKKYKVRDYSGLFNNFYIFLNGNFKEYKAIKLKKVILRFKTEEKFLDLDVELKENMTYELKIPNTFFPNNRKNDCRAYITYFFVVDDEKEITVYHVFDFYKKYKPLVRFWMP
jgi:hypothetical protein